MKIPKEMEKMTKTVKNTAKEKPKKEWTEKQGETYRHRKDQFEFALNPFLFFQCCFFLIISNIFFCFFFKTMLQFHAISLCFHIAVETFLLQHISKIH